MILDEMIEIETSTMQVSKIQTQEDFQENPNLDNVIKKLENKKFEQPKPKIEEKVRTRKFKKPLNTHGARMERIEMVRGLNINNASYRLKEPAKKPLPVPEDLESTMTHAEIEEFSSRFSISWQQVF